MSLNKAKRDELLKRSALIMLVQWAELDANLQHAPGISGIADDAHIAAIENQLIPLYYERHRVLRHTIKEFESDPDVVGSNGTLLHALAVEAATNLWLEDTGEKAERALKALESKQP